MSARISHTDHDHPNTPAARSACRKRMNAGKGPMDAPTERALNAITAPVVEVPVVTSVAPAPIISDAPGTTAGESARLAQEIAWEGYGVATITSWNEYGEEHTGTYKVYEIHADRYEVKEYSGMEGFILFSDISYIGE